ncbi:MAG: 5-dehydro-2-deoxygluconokinase [Propionibacteriaceae bacterium]|nr:5-dehydro-2-deoxygluconokinase [Propionibacteriaceae bacterium]
MLLSGHPCDLLCVGRVGVDLYPTEIGLPLERVGTFGKYLGGSAGNVAVAGARFEHRVALISKTGNDPFGRFVHEELRENGVDDCFVGLDSASPTPVTFCEIFPPDHFPLIFYRTEHSPDLQLHSDSLPMEFIRTARIFWATLTGLSAEPSRSAHLAALAARGRQQWTILDLDYRPKFWPAGGGREQAQAALQYCDVAIGNMEECYIATGLTEPHAAAEALLGMGVKLAVVKQGERGSLAMSADQTIEVPTFKVDVMNGLGAGDAFGGSFCHGLLEGWDLERTLLFANAAGALVASKIECSAAMPSEEQVLALIG